MSDKLARHDKEDSQMTTIYMEMKPENIGFEVFSNLESVEKSTLEHGRYMIFSGKPNFSGTYLDTAIDFNNDGEPVALPDVASVVVHEADSDPETIGRLSYDEGYSDDELGINEPNQFFAKIVYPAFQFEKAWDLAGRKDAGGLKVSIAIKAPQTDTTGQIAIFDISQLDNWPIESIYINRSGKRTPV